VTEEFTPLKHYKAGDRITVSVQHGDATEDGSGVVTRSERDGDFELLVVDLDNGDQCELRRYVPVPIRASIPRRKTP